VNELLTARIANFLEYDVTHNFYHKMRTNGQNSMFLGSNDVEINALSREFKTITVMWIQKKFSCMVKTVY
jgi:hypothetical protein